MYNFRSSDQAVTEGFKLFTHDTSYVLIDSRKKDLFAISTERITRIKHDQGSPLQFFNIEQLTKSKVKIRDSFILEGFFEQLFNRYFFQEFNSEKIRNIISHKEKGVIYSKKYNFFLLFIKAPIFSINLVFQRFFYFLAKKIKKNIIGYKHHLCHAVPGYFFSPFFGKESLVVVFDGWGNDVHSSLWLAKEHHVNLISESSTVRLDASSFVSIGFLYNVFTDVLGFKVGSEEGKVEALAAYGIFDEKLYALCRKGYLINYNNLTWYYNMDAIKKIHNKEYLREILLNIGRENFSATIQKFLENSIVDYLNAVYNKYPIDYLCLSGGVFANVILNMNIYERTPFKNIYIFPAMGDDGAAFGPAILEGIQRGNDLSWLNTKQMPYWGPSYSRSEVSSELNKWSSYISWLDEYDNWPEKAAKMISDGKIVAIFQGKMEFGPRALGNRSILADPRDSKIREKMNLSIKKRPYFQPFCPSILESERERLFQQSYSNKHMTMAFRFSESARLSLPSACHIDGTARPQFVEEKDNPNYFRILQEIKKITGFGVVVNTSFNLHGRAMVMTPEHAIRDFLDCNLDALFIEGFHIFRK